MREWAWSLLVAALAGVSALPAAAAEGEVLPGQAAPVVYRSVAILPVMDGTGGKWKAQSQRMVEAAAQKARAEFGERGFAIVADDRVQQAVSDLGIDLADEEQQRRDSLYRIGKAVQADLVLFLVITDTDQREVDRFLSTSRHGVARVKTWLVDAGNEKAFVSAKTFEGKRTGKYYAEKKGSQLIVIAVENAVTHALRDFLSAYPKKLQPQGGETRFRQKSA